MEAGLPEDDSDLASEGQLLHDYSAHPEYERNVLTPAQQDLLTLADTLTKVVVESVACEDSIKATHTEQQFAAIGISGTPDLVHYYEKDWLVIDRKFGYNVVTRAELNLQLRVYAVITAGKGEGFVAIVQPRAPYDERITIANYNQEDIEDARKQILAILTESENPDAPLVAGEDQCRYCKAKLMCPAFREAMMMPVEAFPNTLIPTQLSVAARQAYLEQRLSECTDEQLGQAILATKLAGFAKELIMEEARKRIRLGELTKFKLGKETSVREITDVRKAIVLLDLAGMAKEDIFDAVHSMALGRLAEALRKRNPAWSAKQTQEWIDKKLSSVIERVARKERVLNA
jgi:hypothetical protein